LCEIILPNVYTVVSRLLNDTDAAKKITLKALVSSWNEIKEYDANQPFLDWIKNSAILFALDELAQNSTLFHVRVEKTGSGSESKDLVELIKTLTPIDRIIFVLHDLEGYSYPEINRFFPDMIEDEIKTELIKTRQYLIGRLS
jgi:DNA-directed RNA polymerase specialized sigma24 family protein